MMKYRVTKVWIQTYPNPIKAKAGDTLQLSQKDTEFAGWVWGVDAMGKQGWIPEAYLTISGQIGTLHTDFNSTELTVVTGDQVEVGEQESGWAWCKNANGFEGWVPLNCLEPYRV